MSSWNSSLGFAVLAELSSVVDHKWFDGEAPISGASHGSDNTEVCAVLRLCEVVIAKEGLISLKRGKSSRTIPPGTHPRLREVSMSWHMLISSNAASLRLFSSPFRRLGEVAEEGKEEIEPCVTRFHIRGRQGRS